MKTKDSNKRICTECGKEFIPNKANNTSFCSAECITKFLTKQDNIYEISFLLKERLNIDLSKEDLMNISKIQSSEDTDIAFKRAIVGLADDDFKTYILCFFKDNIEHLKASKFIDSFRNKEDKQFNFTKFLAYCYDYKNPNKVVLKKPLCKLEEENININILKEIIAEYESTHKKENE